MLNKDTKNIRTSGKRKKRLRWPQSADADAPIAPSSIADGETEDPIAAAMERVCAAPYFKNVYKKSDQTGAYTDISIRKALITDCGEILRLIKELAEYENASESVQITEDTLKCDGWGCAGTKHTSPRFYCLLAVENPPGLPEVTMGMALFYPNYSTWQGMCCYLEDLVVSEPYRGKGVGEALMHAVGNVCLLTGMSRLNWQCLKWNEKPLEFYSNLGAVPMPEWEDLRMTKEAMTKAFGNDLKYFTPVTIAASTRPPISEIGSKVQDCRPYLSWAAAFATANENGSVFDENISDFMSSKRQKLDHSFADINSADAAISESEYLDQEVEQKENGDSEETGGFKQPAMLANFVRSVTSSLP